MAPLWWHGWTLTFVEISFGRLYSRRIFFIYTFFWTNDGTGSQCRICTSGGVYVPCIYTGESYRRRLTFLLLYLCYVLRALINSPVCWFSKWNDGHHHPNHHHQKRQQPETHHCRVCHKTVKTGSIQGCSTGERFKWTYLDRSRILCGWKQQKIWKNKRVIVIIIVIIFITVAATHNHNPNNTV